jgi:hypothetical protein
MSVVFIPEPFLPLWFDRNLRYCNKNIYKYLLLEVNCIIQVVDSRI